MDGNSEEKAVEITPEEKKQKTIEDVYDWAEVFAVSVAIVVLMLTFAIRIATVRGNSMRETLHNGDVLIISDTFYTPSQGDIVVVQQKNSVFGAPLVKRVIATGGQTLEIDFYSWQVYVDGRLMEDDFVRRVSGEMDVENYYSIYYKFLKENDDGGYTMTIPDGYIFVMGDNRNESSDSRSSAVGLVRKNEIMGKVIFRLFPLGKIGAVD